MASDTRKYADEDQIEKILETIHNIAWNNLLLTKTEEIDLARITKRHKEVSQKVLEPKTHPLVSKAADNSATVL